MIEMAFESTRCISQEDFADWVMALPPSDLNHYELLNGRIIMNPPAGYPHGAGDSRVMHLLTTFVFPRNLGQVFGSSQGFDLPSGDTVEPDASYIARARWEAGPAPVPGKFLRIVPDLVVEILSPGNRSRDRGEKKAIYERNGVREYWLVDLEARELTLFALVQDRYDLGKVVAETEQATSGVLDGLVFTVSTLIP
jgi:Uma2 family endonuclease